jgi:predicted RNase H-like HicB family nuclease
MAMPIHEDILSAVRRICRERDEWRFRVKEIVAALPHLNPNSVRTHIVSRCCVNAPKNHPHRWPYFRRVGRGEYEILPAFRADHTSRPDQQGRIEEQAAAFVRSEPLGDTIHIVVRRSAGVYVGEGLEIAVVTQGRSLDELLSNLREAIRLHLEGEKPADLGLIANPRLAITYEEPISNNVRA